VCVILQEKRAEFSSQQQHRTRSSSQKKSRPTLDGGRKKGKPVLYSAEPCNYNPDGVPIYYSVSPHLYRILYYTHREKIERKKMEKAYFYLISFSSLSEFTTMTLISF
jgi:hypothetical protein